MLLGAIGAGAVGGAFLLAPLGGRLGPDRLVAAGTIGTALASERRRDGPYDWNVFEDAAREGRFVETFLVDSRLEHLRQHERVTNADRVLQKAVHGHVAARPEVTHLIAADLSEASGTRDDGPERSC